MHIACLPSPSETFLVVAVGSATLPLKFQQSLRLDSARPFRLGKDLVGTVEKLFLDLVVMNIATHTENGKKHERKNKIRSASSYFNVEIPMLCSHLIFKKSHGYLLCSKAL